jgi:hypothetical protein
VETVSPKVKANWSRSGEFVSDDDDDTVPVIRGSQTVAFGVSREQAARAARLPLGELPFPLSRSSGRRAHVAHD